MYTETQGMSLDNILQGGLIEAANDQISKVLENILDLNTSDAARSVTLTLKFKPAKGNRELVDIEANTKATLAPFRPLATKALVGRGENGVEANELKGGVQEQLDFKANGKVAQLGGAR